ncbi:MAG: hypothetical protein ACRD50_12645 [Candidatus Acidiferrales bacterium]
MPEKSVLVGILPEVVTLEAGEQMVWVSGAGNLRVEFDPQRCPFSSNVFQAPPDTRLMSGAARPGTKPGAFKYRVFLNDQLIGHGEVLYRG